MRIALLTTHSTAARRALMMAASVAALITFIGLSRSYSRPRAWAASQVPVAFWAWRMNAPSAEEWAQAERETGAKILFLHAGQLDYSKGKVTRIRPATGRMPRIADLHLVYNATRTLLKNFENIEPQAITAEVARTFKQDVARAAEDCAVVSGVQLDIDVPTRLLTRYARLLELLRKELPPGVKLSVTGLPSWANSPDVRTLLAAVDFWTPQCYGAEIPERLERVMPIASPREVRTLVARLRELNKPFFVGLAAYGYVVLYSRDGRLIELRGDLDPSLVAAHPSLELIERRNFESSLRRKTERQSAGEWRYVYHANTDAVIDGLVMRAGENLMLDVPSAASLRECAQAAREEAGAQLLGLCVFRLPSAGDTTALTLSEISAALAGREPEPATALQAALSESLDKQFNHFTLEAVNTGVANTLLGDDALIVDVRVPQGSVHGVVAIEGFTSFETLSESPANNAANIALRPCSMRIANIVRLKVRAWKPGARARVVLSVTDVKAESIRATVKMNIDDGRVWVDEQAIKIERVNEQ